MHLRSRELCVSLISNQHEKQHHTHVYADNNLCKIVRGKRLPARMAPHKYEVGVCMYTNCLNFRPLTTLHNECACEATSLGKAISKAARCQYESDSIPSAQARILHGQMLHADKRSGRNPLDCHQCVESTLLCTSPIPMKRRQTSNYKHITSVLFPLHYFLAVDLYHEDSSIIKM